MSKRDANGNSADRFVTHLLRRAGQAADEIFGRHVHSLTPRQYAVLVSISEGDGLSQTGIVERTGVDRSTIAELVRRMAKKGLVLRRRSRADARAYVLRLTEAGRQALRLAEPEALRADTVVLGRLSGAQRKVFIDALKIVSVGCGE